MLRGTLAVFLLTIPALAQNVEPGQLDASRALFSTLAAINAVGYDADLDSPSNSPVRDAIRKELAAKQIPVLDELRAYFNAHRREDWTQEFSQYVSYALCVTGPPDFKFRYKPQELPPDVTALQGLSPLLARFDKEAGLEQLWTRSQPAFEQMIARYQKPAIDALIEINAYTRNAGSGMLGSRFQVYVDLLGAPNQIQTRSYRNDYFVVVTPSAEPFADDVRHGFLHFLIDPLCVRHTEELVKQKGLGDFAQNAPALEQFYKDDFLLLATESLIKAVEIRLAPPARRDAMLQRTLAEGHVLAGAFVDGLVGYEKQEQSLRFYFAELIKGIDPAKETARLDKVQFVRERAQRKAKVVPAEQRPEPVGAYKTVEVADQAYEKGDLEAARTGYLNAIQETEEKPLEAKAYYGLAKIAIRKNDPDLALELLEKSIASAPDDYVKGWVLVYLARLSDAQGLRDKAKEYYQAASEVPNASLAARQAALKGLNQEFKK